VTGLKGTKEKKIWKVTYNGLAFSKEMAELLARGEVGAGVVIDTLEVIRCQHRHLKGIIDFDERHLFPPARGKKKETVA
jgi:hypothetical protein